MTASATFIAIDLGASNGRVLSVDWNGEVFKWQEVRRFQNRPVHILDRVYWDVLRLWSDVQTGISACLARSHTAPAGLGVVAWGVDYGLLDTAGRLLSNPVHYRDCRTNGIPELAFRYLSAADIFRQTGVQIMQINTLFQLYSMVKAGDSALQRAGTLLMMPDLFHYWLSGEMACEYTVATTTQMYDCGNRCWASALLEQLQIPSGILPRIVEPGTILGTVRESLRGELGLTNAIPVIAGASHDTASAVTGIPGMDEHSMFISCGTWSLVGIELEAPLITPETFAMNFANEGGAGGTTLLQQNVCGLWLLQECVRVWHSAGEAIGWEELLPLALSASALQSFVDPDDPAFLAPPDMPRAIQEYCCKTGQPVPRTLGALVRCCLESLSLKYRWVLQRLAHLSGRAISKICIVGGGANNSVLCQFTADACGCIVSAGPSEAAALGSAVAQAIATSFLSDIAEGREAIAASIQLGYYQPSRSEAWERAYQRFAGILTAEAQRCASAQAATAATSSLLA